MKRNKRRGGGRVDDKAMPRSSLFVKLGNGFHLVEPVMRLLENTLSAHPTDIRMPYLFFSKVLSDTSALKLSISAIPASPLSWT